MSLANKVLLITGASKGIGRALALKAASEGASIVINYRSDKSAADALVSQIGPKKALAVQADAGDIADIEKLVQAAVEKFGRIDVVVPNGNYHLSALLMIDPFPSSSQITNPLPPPSYLKEPASQPLQSESRK